MSEVPEAKFLVAVVYDANTPMVICPNCSGTGIDTDWGDLCTTCVGLGEVRGTENWTIILEEDNNK